MTECSREDTAEKHVTAWLLGWRDGCMASEGAGYLFKPALAETYRRGRDEGCRDRAAAEQAADVAAGFRAPGQAQS